MGRDSNHPKSALSQLQGLAQLPGEGAPHQGPPRPRQIQHRLTSAQQQELLERYVSGERAVELAEAFEISRTTLDRLLTTNGLRRPRSMTEDEVATATELYDQGWSCQRIGGHLGWDHGTVWRALKLAGVELRPPWTRST